MERIVFVNDIENPDLFYETYRQCIKYQEFIKKSQKLSKGGLDQDTLLIVRNNFNIGDLSDQDVERYILVGDYLSQFDK